MTSRLMRLCCLCLLVLALPLQGLAAVAWLHGGPVAAHGLAAADDAAAVDALLDDTDAVPPCHGHAAGAHALHDAAHAASPADTDTASPPPHADPGHAGCSACAACCGHGTAPPATLPLAPRLSLPAVSPAPGRAPAVAPWSADGIERPPRG